MEDILGKCVSAAQYGRSWLSLSIMAAVQRESAQRCGILFHRPSLRCECRLWTWIFRISALVAIGHFAESIKEACQKQGRDRRWLPGRIPKPNDSTETHYCTAWAVTAAILQLFLKNINKHRRLDLCYILFIVLKVRLDFCYNQLQSPLIDIYHIKCWKTHISPLETEWSDLYIQMNMYNKHCILVN